MDFDQALKEAEALGISRQQFLNIWKLEAKTKQMQDEYQFFQMQRDAGKAQTSGDASSLTSKVEAQLQKFSGDQKQVLNNLREELQQQNQTLISDISRLLEGFASQVGRAVKGELETALSGLSLSDAGTRDNSRTPSSSQSPQRPENIGRESREKKLKYTGDAGTSGGVNSIEDFNEAVSEKAKRKRKRGRDQELALSDCTSSNASDKAVISEKSSFSTLSGGVCSQDNTTSNAHFFPQDRSANMEIWHISNVAKLGLISASHEYYLHDCPCKVKLSLWFTSEKKLRMCVTLCGLSPKPLRLPRVVTISGEIQNSNSSAYTPLFSQSTPPLTLEKLWSQNVELSLELKTKRGSYSNITLETLRNRNYISKNRGSVSINWSVMSREVKA